MADEKNPVPGRKGGGESGGGGYTQPDVQDGDNNERTRPVKIGRKADKDDGD